MNPINELRALWFKLNALEKASTLMGWDRQVLMPSGGAAARTEHSGRLARMAHELLVNDSTRRLVDVASSMAEPGTEDAAIARVFRRELSTRGSLPTGLVERKSRVSSDAYEAWKGARASQDFSILQPYLEALFDIARETASYRGYTDHIYDPLIDLFEEGTTYAEAKTLLEAVKMGSKDLVAQVRDQQALVDDSFLRAEWDADSLRHLMQAVTGELGFEYSRGRLDLCSNAFCTNLSRNDIRMTTRHSPTLKGVFFSSLHEMGHGLYEQGSSAKWDRTPLAGGTSLAVHESQSRLWENIVGRSEAFCHWFMPVIHKALPELSGISAQQFYAAVAKLSPGSIRIGSDEVTYNLHICIRFELECDLLTGAVAVKDLPDAWNAKTEDFLGLRPNSVNDGVLQDVHWSRGSVGYFPTYTYGNLLGWQFWDRMQQDLGSADDLMRAGRFGEILNWLTENIYTQGKLYASKDLANRVLGTGISAKPFLAAMNSKYASG